MSSQTMMVMLGSMLAMTKVLEHDMESGSRAIQEADVVFAMWQLDLDNQQNINTLRFGFCASW